jgi:hypothetical protein
MNKNLKCRLNHNNFYIDLIKHIKNKKFSSKNKTNNNNKNIDIKDNIKKLREKRKKKNINIEELSNNNNKLYSNIKLIGLKTIFSNFYNSDKKQLFSFNTPKVKSPSSFNSLHHLNISTRFNKTEEKIDFLNKNNQKSEDNINYKLFMKIKNNPQYSIEYIDEMFQNLLIEENEYFEEINYDSFNINTNYRYCINPDSWKFFINSLINIQDLLYFDEQTLFLTIQIFDKYLSEILYKETNKNIVEENLDIVIVTSLIIASKREEIKLYSMKDYLNLLPDKYSIKDLIKQESDILYKFNFNLLLPNMLNFFELLSIIYKLNNIQRNKGLYLLNIILLDCNLLRIPPSLIAFCVIKIIFKKNIRANILNRMMNKYKSGNKYKEIKILKIIKDDNMINNICRYIQYIEKTIKISNYDSVLKKFNTMKYYFAPIYS